MIYIKRLPQLYELINMKNLKQAIEEGIDVNELAVVNSSGQYIGIIREHTSRHIRLDDGTVVSDIGNYSIASAVDGLSPSDQYPAEKDIPIIRSALLSAMQYYPLVGQVYKGDQPAINISEFDGHIYALDNGETLDGNFCSHGGKTPDLRVPENTTIDVVIDLQLSPLNKVGECFDVYKDGELYRKALRKAIR
ncbi:MAG: hypothetical protein V1870_02985 [Candidatus Aenigmatarchaeota archaeon]